MDNIKKELDGMGVAINMMSCTVFDNLERQDRMISQLNNKFTRKNLILTMAVGILGYSLYKQHKELEQLKMDMGMVTKGE